jgi:nitrate reductase NapE component
METKKEIAKAEEKKAKLKKTLTLIACILGIAAVATVGIYAFVQDIINDSQAEIYSDGIQTVTLFTNGTFTANLANGLSLRGRYEKIDLPYVTLVRFMSDGLAETAFLKDGVLQLPYDWEVDVTKETFLPRR